MKHDEYKRHIRSRGDLGPDQKAILIQDDLDRRKGSSNYSPPSTPSRPTMHDVEVVEEFKHQENEWIIGKYNDQFWAVRRYPIIWFGPRSSFQRIKNEMWRGYEREDVEHKSVNEFEEVEELVNEGDDWVVGEADGQFWAFKRHWQGPEKSVQDAKDRVK